MYNVDTIARSAVTGEYGRGKVTGKYSTNTNDMLNDISLLYQGIIRMLEVVIVWIMRMHKINKLPKW